MRHQIDSIGSAGRESQICAKIQLLRHNRQKGGMVRSHPDSADLLKTTNSILRSEGGNYPTDTDASG